MKVTAVNELSGIRGQMEVRLDLVYSQRENKRESCGANMYSPMELLF